MGDHFCAAENSQAHFVFLHMQERQAFRRTESTLTWWPGEPFMKDFYSSLLRHKGGRMFSFVYSLLTYMKSFSGGSSYTPIPLHRQHSPAPCGLYFGDCLSPS